MLERFDLIYDNIRVSECVYIFIIQIQMIH